ncbi:MAG: SH3 domain-containing protein [Pseudomonadota bacterium]
MKIFVFVMIFLLALPSSVHAQLAKVVPVDEAQADVELRTFRDQLLEAVVTRDIDYIVSIAAPDILLDFGSGMGQEELRLRLTEGRRFYSEDENPEDYIRHREALWLGFESALRLGGVYDAENREFVAPHYFAADLGDLSYDPFFTYFTIAQNVTVRDRPNRYGTVIDRLDYELVERLDGGDGTSYARVQLERGRTGWVHKDLLRSAVDYRAIFEKHDGKWIMTVLIAGD